MGAVMAQTPFSPQSFFDQLTPAVVAENTDIASARERLEGDVVTWHQWGFVPAHETDFLESLGNQYALGGYIKHHVDYFDDLDQDETYRWLREVLGQPQTPVWQLPTGRYFTKLLIRVDEVPVSQVLAQAALESNFGRSRFAKQGHAYFGEHCYAYGCGIKPLQLPPESTLQVKAFPSVDAAVVSYVTFLNTRPTFVYWRHERQQLRACQQPLSGLLLATGLSRYSEVGADYVPRIQGIIQHYKLDQYDETTADDTTVLASIGYPGMAADQCVT